MGKLSSLLPDAGRIMNWMTQYQTCGFQSEAKKILYTALRIANNAKKPFTDEAKLMDNTQQILDTL